MRLPKRFEDMMYRGLTPGAPARLPLGERLRRWAGARAERLVKPGEAPSDPFYISNLSWKKKLKRGSLIAAPILLAIVVIVGQTNDWFRGTHHSPILLPEVPHQIKQSADLMTELQNNSQLEVMELALKRETYPPRITGSVRNNSDQNFEAAEISFNVTNNDGTMLGSVATIVRNIPAHGTEHFEVDIPQKGATLALVRDTRRIKPDTR